MPKTALVIVHLSSLDNYAEFSHDATGNYDDAFELGQRIAQAVVNFDGKVIIVDQMWRYLPEPSSKPRMEADGLIYARKRGVEWMKFDEQFQDWGKFLIRLEKRLRKYKIRSVILGGVWHDPELESGCVTEVYLYLKKRFSVTVDPELVGCETDYGDRGDPEFIFRK